jgi:hypothetical protein
VITRHPSHQTSRPAAARWFARSADAALLDRLAVVDWHGRVHSVFERTVNLESADGAMMTLAARECDNAPDSVVVSAARFDASGIAVGELARAARFSIDIGRSFHLALDGAVPWQEDLPRLPANLDRLGTNLRRMRTRLDAVAGAGGMPAAAAPGSWDAAISAALRDGGARLRASLLRGDLDAFRADALSLVGLGPGLTPSGDDFLVGLFAVLNLDPGLSATLAPACADIVAAAAQRTNAISLAALRHAATGRVREAIAALLRQLVLGSAIDAALARVLAIGSTSGADIAAGIACGAGIHLELAAPRRVLPHCVPAVAQRGREHASL